MSAGGPSLRRHVAGFLVAPLSVPLLLAAADLVRVAQLDAPPGYVRSVMRATVAFAATTLAPLGYAAALSLGVPLVWALRSVRRLTVPWVVGVSTAAAALASAAALTAIPPCVGESDCLAPWLLVGGVGALLGVAVGAVYCLVAGVPWRAQAAADAGPAG